MWSIGSSGFRRVATIDFNKFSAMFEKLWAAQHDLVLKGEEKFFEAFQGGGWKALSDNSLPDKDKLDKAYPPKK